MWPFKKKGVREEGAEEVHRWTAFAEERKRRFEEHLPTLTGAERKDLARGEHPSQSHAFEERAKPFADELAEVLRGRGLACDVEVGFYHMGRLVLTVTMPEDPGEGLPWFYRGFEVKYHFTAGPKRG